jgi:hypothetical protein
MSNKPASGLAACIGFDDNGLHRVKPRLAIVKYQGHDGVVLLRSALHQTSRE